MKRTRKLIVILLFVLLAFCFPLNAFALDVGFDTCELSAEDDAKARSNIKLSPFYNERKRTVDSFAVSESGQIAIASSSGLSKTVQIYANDGSFKQGYEVETYGTIGVLFDGEEAVIYFVRSDLLAKIDSDGRVIELAQLKDSSKINSFDKFVFATERKIGDTKYHVGTSSIPLNLLVFGNSRLTIIGSDGIETVLSDCSSEQALKRVVFYALGIAAIIIAVKVISREIKDNIRKSKNDAG